MHPQAINLVLTRPWRHGARELPLRDGLARVLLARRLLDRQPRRPELPSPQHLAEGVNDRHILRPYMQNLSCVMLSHGFQVSRIVHGAARLCLTRAHAKDTCFAADMGATHGQAEGHSARWWVTTGLAGWDGSAACRRFLAEHAGVAGQLGACIRSGLRGKQPAGLTAVQVMPGVGPGLVRRVPRCMPTDKHGQHRTHAC